MATKSILHTILDPVGFPPTPSEAHPKASKHRLPWQSLPKGELIDITATGRLMGFTVPLLATSAVFTDCVEWTIEDNRRRCYQNEAGRLWDLVFAASRAAQRAAIDNLKSTTFDLYRVPRSFHSLQSGIVTLCLILVQTVHEDRSVLIQFSGKR